MIAKCEGGQKWSRPATPNLGVGSHNKPSTPIQPPQDPEPQNIFLEGALPQQSQLLVSDSKTQALTIENDDDLDSPVILSSKMTLSLISLDSPVEDEKKQQDLSQKTEDENLFSADSTLLNVDSVSNNNNYM